MTHAPDTAPTPATSKTLRWVLVASLALNLAVGGMMLGAVLKGGPGGRDMLRDMGFGPYDAALLPRDRDTLRKALRQKSGDLKANRAMAGADLVAVVSSLRASPFDPAALAAAMAAQQDHLSARMQLGTEAMRAFLVSLAPQERLAFADRLEQRFLHGPKEPADPPKK
jgi:uncharacterized membrane protein